LNKPFVTIITAVKDARETVRDCMQSVQGQSYKNIEHIIIDGLSIDGTLEIVGEMRTSNTIVVSERDAGIYDAINKGLGIASGDVIGILHSDDVYENDFVIETVVQHLEANGCDSCYGDLVYVNKANKQRIVRYWSAGVFERNKFKRGWMPPHPTLFVRRSIYEKYGNFNLSLGSAADYELILRFLLKHRISTAYIPKVLVRMRFGGVSNASLRNRLRANSMDRKAWAVNGLKPYPWTTYLKPILKIGQYCQFLQKRKFR
jgi:glycosyltransferase